MNRSGSSPTADVVATRGPAVIGGRPGLAALSAVLCRDVAGSSEAELIDDAGIIRECQAWLDAHVARLVAEVARRRGGPTDEDAAVEASLDAQGPVGSGREPRPHFWERQVFAARLRISEFEARRLVSTSVALEDGRLPNTKAALQAGVISWRHAEALAVKTTVLTDELAGQVECQVLSDRRLVTARQYGNRAGELADQLAPPPEQEPRVGTTAAWENPDGSVQIAATLDAEGGRTVARAVEAYATPFGPDDMRAQSERWADALVEISRVALDHLDTAPAGGTRWAGRT